MKDFSVLGGLQLLFSLIWTCSGEQPVYIRCSPSWFLVRVKSTAFDNDLPMAPGEVFLGNNCPVTSVHQGFYEFLYHPNDCNIRTKVFVRASDSSFIINCGPLQTMRLAKTSYSLYYISHTSYKEYDTSEGQVLPGGCLLFTSEIIFISNLSDLEASIPVACIVPSHPAPIKIMKVNDADTQDGPPKGAQRANLCIGGIIKRILKLYSFVNHWHIFLHLRTWKQM